MKKWFFLLLAVIVVGGVWWYLRTYIRYSPEWSKAKFGEVSRGDIRVPISASGLIEADKRINIKPKASGEVIEVKVEPGDYVHKGDILVLLKRDDEERRLVQAQAGLTRAKAHLAQTNVAVEKARLNILSSESNVADKEANGRLIGIDLKWAENKRKLGGASEREFRTLEARRDVNNAHLNAARANAEIAKASLTEVEQSVIIQQATVDEATKAVETAQERLDETTIRAPQDAIVTEVHLTEGMLVQSATQGLTGGTPVMTLADISKFKVVTRVDESDIGRVLRISPIDALPEIDELRAAAKADAEALEQRTGVVQLTVDAFPDETYEGRIVRAEPQGRLNAGSAVIQFNVHVEVTDERRHMLPLGTQAQVEFTVEEVTDALLVPAEAVMTFEDQRGVWIKTRPEPGSADKFSKKFVPCRFGITDGAKTQLVGVLGGNEELKEGQPLITKLPATRDED